MAISTIDTSVKHSSSSQSSPSPYHQSPSSSTSTIATPISVASPSANGVTGTSRNVPILPVPKDASLPVKVESQTQVPKKRRIPGACDICKKKKSQHIPFARLETDTN
jgi:hypothetical protein